MKIPPASTDAFNIVSIGAWNAAIFSPEWAKNELALDQDREVVLAIPMQLTLPPRLTVDGVNIYPASQSLAIDGVTYDDDAIVACVNKFHRLAELLPHTPVSAVGVNFRFYGDLGESEVLANLFAFSDAGLIDADTYNLSEAVLKRSFVLADATVLNLNIHSFTDQVRIEFNFHMETRSLADAALKVTVERVQNSRQQAMNFLSSVYGITLDA